MRRFGVAFVILLAPLPVLAERTLPERQREEVVGEIPAILHSALWTIGPTFVTADEAIGPDGEPNADVLDELSARNLRGHLDNFKRGALDRVACVPYGAVYVDRVNPPDRSSIPLAARSAELIIEGRVVGRDYGFFKGDIPGQVLKVETDRVLRGSGLLDWYYVFYPVGTFKAGPYTFCKTDHRLPAPPQVGERVLLLLEHVLDSQQPFLDLRDEHSLIVVDEKGQARLPESFERSEAGRLTGDQVLAEIERAVQER